MLQRAETATRSFGAERAVAQPDRGAARLSKPAR